MSKEASKAESCAKNSSSSSSCSCCSSMVPKATRYHQKRQKVHTSNLLLLLWSRTMLLLLLLLLSLLSLLSVMLLPLLPMCTSDATGAKGTTGASAGVDVVEWSASNLILLPQIDASPTNLHRPHSCLLFVSAFNLPLSQSFSSPSSSRWTSTSTLQPQLKCRGRKMESTNHRSNYRSRCTARPIDGRISTSSRTIITRSSSSTLLFLWSQDLNQRQYGLLPPPPPPPAAAPAAVSSQISLFVAINAHVEFLIIVTVSSSASSVDDVDV